VGFVPAGGDVVIDTPAGSRIIYVVGLRSASKTACSSYAANQPDSANLSDPFLIAAQSAEIPPGASSVTVAPALDLTKKVIDCKFIQSGGGSNSTPFGDKRDGIITAVPGSSPTPMLAGTSTISTGVTRTGSGTLPATKIFAASRRIKDIATSGASPGAMLTTLGIFTPNDLDAGDEIAWYVAGGNSSLASPDDPVNGACGGGMYLGQFGTARISSIDVTAQTVLLDRPISGSPATIRTANLSAAPSTSDYCTILISRVSSFESIVADGGSNLTLKAAPFNYVEGTGGLLMVRAKSIYVGTSTTLTLDASGVGFAGGTAMTGGGSSLMQGQGVNSSGTSSTKPNYNGGSPGTTSSVGGSGGGHAGAGGLGLGTASPSAGFSGGSPLNHCSGGLPCDPLVDQKVFFGGGGGAAGSAATGGAGGGVVILYADMITGPGTLVLTADGAAGSTGGVGGGAGAGGAVGLMTRTSTVTALTLTASGGTGGSGTSSGGGGGGGVVNLTRCPTNFLSRLLTSVAGGLYSSGTASGGLGLNKLIDDSTVCSLP
jgi:hypothetical protein